MANTNGSTDLTKLSDEQLRVALRQAKNVQKVAADGAREIVLEMQRRVPLTSAVPATAVQSQSAKQG